MMLMLMHTTFALTGKTTWIHTKLKKQPVHIGIFVGIDNENRARAYKSLGFGEIWCAQTKEHTDHRKRVKMRWFYHGCIGECVIEYPKVLRGMNK